MKTIKYKVQEADRLGTIAKWHGITLEELLKIPGNEVFIKNPDLIHPGDKVTVPAKYIVKPALPNIAAQHGTTEKALLEIPGNEQFKKHPLKAGDTIKLAGNNATYKVQEGDRLGTIAKWHGINLEELLKIPGNEAFIKNHDLIHPGNKVVVPAKYIVNPALPNIAAQHETTTKALLGISGNESLSEFLKDGDVVQLAGDHA